MLRKRKAKNRTSLYDTSLHKRKNREWEGVDECNEINEKKLFGKAGGGGASVGGSVGRGYGCGVGGSLGAVGVDVGYFVGVVVLGRASVVYRS